MDKYLGKTCTPDGFRSAGEGSREIIVIASHEILPRIERELGGGSVRAFSTLEELDRWRRSSPQLQTGISIEVARALDEAGRRPSLLSAPLEILLERVAARPRVPSLRDLEQQWTSRRSFYRSWSAEIPFPPSTFLRRVRTLHAQRLLANGLTRKKAALLAGYRSVDAMRRNIELGSRLR